VAKNRLRGQSGTSLNDRLEAQRCRMPDSEALVHPALTFNLIIDPVGGLERAAA
jgi:hypothetical protein